MTRMTVLSAVLMALAFGLLLFGIYRVTLAHSQPAGVCVTQVDRDRIHSLTLEGIDQAFRDQVKLLFAVWLKDPEPEPKRATLGMSNAIYAYQRAHANAMNWRPTICKG